MKSHSFGQDIRGTIDIGREEPPSAPEPTIIGSGGGQIEENGSIVYPDGTVIRPDGSVRFPDGTFYTREDLSEAYIEFSKSRHFCFGRGTLVDMADGSKEPIDEVTVGDYVVAFEILSGRLDGPLASGRVTQIYKTPSRALIDSHGTLVTPQHPFLCEDGAFRPVIQILENDGFVVGRDGELIRARTGERVLGSAAMAQVREPAYAADVCEKPWTLPDTGPVYRVAGKHTVYNFAVEGLHTYIADGYRVHNISFLGAAIGGAAGAFASSQLLGVFGVDDLALNLVGSAAGGALGGVIGQEAARLLDEQTSIFTGDNISVAAENFLRKFGASVLSQAINVGGQALGRSVARQIGFDSDIVDLTASIAGGALTTYVAAEVALSVFQTSDPTGIVADVLGSIIEQGSFVPNGVIDPKLLDPSFGASLINAGASAVGAFAGRELAAALFDTSSIEAQIGGTLGQITGTIVAAQIGLGSTILGALGAQSLNFLAPGLGVLVGSFAGTFLGSAVGSLFGGGEPDDPLALVPVGHNGRTWNYGDALVDDGGDPQVARSMAKAARDALRGFSNAVGGSLLEPPDPNMYYGYEGNQFFVDNDPFANNGYMYTSHDAQSVIREGVREQIREVDIEGGDLYVKRALRYNVAFSQIAENVSTAMEYGFFKDNEALFLASGTWAGPGTGPDSCSAPNSRRSRCRGTKCELARPRRQRISRASRDHRRSGASGQARVADGWVGKSLRDGDSVECFWESHRPSSFLQIRPDVRQ